MFDGGCGKETVNEHHPRSLPRPRPSGPEPGDARARGGKRSLPAAGRLDADTERSLDLEERATDTARMRVVGVAALSLWTASLALDAVLAHGVIHEGAAGFLAIKALACVPAVAVVVRLLPRFPLLSRRALYAAAFAVFLPPVVAASLLALRHPAVEAAYGHAIVGVLVALGAALPQPLRRGLPLTGAVAFTFAAAVAAGAVADEGVRARLADPAERALLWMIVSTHVVAGALVVVSAQLQHGLRRQGLLVQLKSRYRLKELLGEGGMGQVWRAWHPGLGCDVALKMLRNGGGEELVQRFLREIKATAQLVHPNTVRVLDCGLTDDGAWYYTMELLHGRTLATVVGAEGPLPPARVVYLVAQAARALSEAHGRGLVHRDVKPENLFVTTLGGETDFVKVLDFGIARAAYDDDSLTREGMVIGTPRYMAPEQERGLRADARSDVYSLGATLYLALTAEPPLPGESLSEIQASRSRGVLVPPSWRVPGIPPVLDEIVMRCLSTDPAARYADAGALARALLDTGLSRAHRPSPPAGVVEMEPVRRRTVTRDLSGEPSSEPPTPPWIMALR